jgi:hypothetical protein
MKGTAVFPRAPFPSRLAVAAAALAKSVQIMYIGPVQPGSGSSS